MGFPAPSIAVNPLTGVLYAGRGAGVANLYQVNPNTAAATLIGNAGFAGAALAGLGFNASGVLYAAVNAIDDGGTGADTLAIINISTGAGTAVGPFGGGIGSAGGPGGIEGLAFSPSGQLYGTSARQSSSSPSAVPTLYTINVTTGTATAVGPIRDAAGNAPNGGVVGLEYYLDGTLYGGTGQGTGSLVTINPTTARFTLVGPSVSGSLATLGFLQCGCFADADCNDFNACTIDTCSPGLGCQHRPNVGEPSPMLFSAASTMSWTTTAGATHWNTYRGTIPSGLLGSRLPGSVYDQVCFESADALGDGATTSTDAANPPTGTGYYYLISGEGACGEGDIGHNSSGAFIPNAAPCPTPP
jgi:hypothetical protein